MAAYWINFFTRIHDPDRGRFRGWLFAVVRNQLKMFRRSQARHPRGAELPADVPDDTAAETWDLECRRRLFAWACAQVRQTVSDATWQAFWRTAVDGEPGKGVAADLGLSVAAVYHARGRILARLKELVRSAEEP